ncbi:hypothetical protein GGU45_000653 [Niabella hirudinis]
MRFGFENQFFIPLIGLNKAGDRKFFDKSGMVHF